MPVEVFLCVTKLGRFGRSTGSVGFGKEENDGAAAGEFLQREFASAVGFEFEVWGFLSDFQHLIVPKRRPPRGVGTSGSSRYINLATS